MSEIQKYSTMKTKRQIFVLVVTMALLSACNKEPVVPEPVLPVETEKESLSYTDNLKQAVYSVIINNPEFNQQKKKLSEFPLVKKIDGLRIEDENGNKIVFSEMNPDMQSEFIEYYMNELGKDINRKIENAPEFRQSLIEENKLLAEFNNQICATKSTGTDIVRSLENLQKKANEQKLLLYDMPQTKTMSKEVIVNEINVNSSSLQNDVINTTSSTAKGDILITLPNSDRPGSRANFGYGNNGMWCGHGEVITDPMKKEDAAKEIIKDYTVFHPEIMEYAYRGYKFNFIHFDDYFNARNNHYQENNRYYEILENIQTYYTKLLSTNYSRAKYEEFNKAVSEIRDIHWKLTSFTDQIIGTNKKNLIANSEKVNEWKTIIVVYANGQTCTYKLPLKYLYVTEGNRTTNFYKIHSINYKTSSSTIKAQSIPEILDNISTSDTDITSQVKPTWTVQKVLNDQELKKTITQRLLNAETTTACWDGQGVIKESLNSWYRHQDPWFILKIKKISYVYNTKTRKYTKVLTSVSNYEETEFANELKKHYGKQYVQYIEFPIAKWLAPVRFTCTSLIWWAAQQVYDIDLSPWVSTVVSPSDIYLSEYTFIKQKKTPQASWYI